MTSQVRERAWEFFGQVEERGGFIACLDDGWLHARALENQAEQLRRIEGGEQKVIGVNYAKADVSPFDVEGFQGISDAGDRGMHPSRRSAAPVSHVGTARQ